MRAWPAVSFDTLTEEVPAVSIFDSATQQLKKLNNSGEVKLYVCGITPYDATHLGHAATYVAFDTLIRIWQASGASVNYVQNVTDIDDPLLERANKIGKNWQDIAIEQTELFRQDMMALRVIPPANYIGAVESIPLVIKQIGKLMERKSVYTLEDDYYYLNSKSKTSGKIAHLSMDEMIELFTARGGDPLRPGKKEPLDALLWRHKRPGEPSWASPYGDGRPGWHIECAAIALEFLGENIDVQGGGSDLKFPHHEMSAAHAQTITGQGFAKNYVHTGMVSLDGEKMSKSLGNLVFVSKLRDQGVDPMAIRLTILSQHYRSDWEWFDNLLSVNVERLAKWRQVLASAKCASSVSKEVISALANDLDTPTTIDIIDSWVESSLNGATQDSPVAMGRVIDTLLGIK
jgi:L-cysteine:1D-myo-inositol 2-amino-2-deoxy-alpha-D-glucopyranoside ligase